MRVRYEKLEDPKYLNEFWRVTSATSDIEFRGQGILTKVICAVGKWCLSRVLLKRFRKT